MSIEQGINVGAAPGAVRPAINRKMLLMWGVAISAGLAGLIALSMSGGSTVPTVAFNQVASSHDTVKVYGILDKNSIRSLKGANMVAFELIEEKTNRHLSVLYDNPATGLPANFPNASHALATGMYDPVNQRFVTTNVLTKCPSKYKEQDLDINPKAVGDWQKAIGAAGGR